MNSRGEEEEEKILNDDDDWQSWRRIKAEATVEWDKRTEQPMTEKLHLIAHTQGEISEFRLFFATKLKRFMVFSVQKL